jgi:hypothetical protein
MSETRLGGADKERREHRTKQPAPPEAHITCIDACKETVPGWLSGCQAQVSGLLLPACAPPSGENDKMDSPLLSPARRKRLLKAYGPCPAGYTHEDLERFLDLLYGLYSHVYTLAELRQIVVNDPFDRREVPRCMKLVDLADWLEALLA